MKIGILTQPLHNNYGGLLQAYALQTVLKRMGNDAWIVRRESIGNSYSIKGELRRSAKNMVKRVLCRPLYFPPSKEQTETISRFTGEFVEKYIIPRTSKLYTNDDLRKEVNRQTFDAYVVGSDQVWRPCYSPCLPNYFLDFTTGQSVRRVSYAASFGVENWELSPKQTRQCRPLLQRFDAVSVREESGVTLCKDYFDTDAVHVLDPTMLLERKDYEALVRNEQEPQSTGSLFYYILDSTKEKQNTVEHVASETNLASFTVMPHSPSTAENRAHHLEDCIYPPPTQWLRAYMDAKMVVTDSFHGCVFAIIFNKPFLAIGNHSRGQARFDSLFKMFGLEDRLVYSLADVTKEKIEAPINWEQVNRRREDLKIGSLEFLTKALNNEHA